MTVRMDHDLSVPGFIRTAKDFHAALQILASSSLQSAPVVSVLAGHSLELGLKAFLLQTGRTESELRSLGHDLAKTWDDARNRGLPVEDSPPWWCEALSSAYDRPFMARYVRSNTGLVLPNTAALVTDLGLVLDQVVREITARGGTA